MMPALLERKEEYDPSPKAGPPDPASHSASHPASDGSPPLPEKTLARLWQKRAARQREFRTSAGRRVRVLYPGRPGASAGPDFRDALLEVEGLGLVRGDVELHLRQRDWYSHGHADDPNYDGVVLHAALETDTSANPRPTNLHSGHRAPVISLASLLEEEAAQPAGGEENATCGEQTLWSLLEKRSWRRPSDAEEMGQLLDTAGDARFRARAAVFAALNREQPPCQTLYEALLEALGYRANRQPFLKLARLASWPALAAEARSCFPEQRPAVLEARLLQLSGLADGKGDVPRRLVSRRLRGYGSAMRPEEWHTFRVRPANHPRHRIAGAARLLARCLVDAPWEGEGVETGQPEDRLISYMAAAVVTGSPARLTSALAVPADGAKAPAYVGTGRARDMAVNVVLPFCHAQAGLESASPALALYAKYPKLQDNEITREMADQLVLPEWGKVVATARRQQGLIHLHRQLN